MPKIETVYFINHNHTDLGYTDHPDVVLRQHMRFIDDAIELCEATAGDPTDTEFKWTCESSGIAERYLETSQPAQVERFLRLHREGRIDVTGMKYSFLSILSLESLLRSLYPVRRMRERFGVKVHAAMNCDVNGAAWILADVLPAIGIDLFAMAINADRGRMPSPRPRPFWWEGPGGGRLATWSGYCYAWGTMFWGLGDPKKAAELVPLRVRELEEDPEYPFDFALVQVTHPQASDNGPPYADLPSFAREWNAAGNTPQMVFTTLSEFASMLVKGKMDGASVWRGDWVNWWSDGAGSSAFETALHRRSQELLGIADMLGAWIQGCGGAPAIDEIDAAYNQAILYGEHTWGASDSIREPASARTRALWNAKAGYAYRGWAGSHDLVGRHSQELAFRLAGEGDRLFVLNTLPWKRSVVITAPNDQSGHPCAHVMDQFFPVFADGDAPITASLPPTGFSIIPASPTRLPQVKLGERSIENDWYRVVVDPTTGGLASWFDKDKQIELAAESSAWRLGQCVCETVDSPDGRQAIFAVDFSRFDCGTRYTDTPWSRTGPIEVGIKQPRIEGGGASISAQLSLLGCREARVEYFLPAHRKALAVRYVLDKLPVTDPESVYIVFPLALGPPSFLLDLNGVPTEPEVEQILGSSRDWYTCQRWTAVSDGETAVTLVTLDAPLVQLGGIKTGAWAEHLEAGESTIVSWALNNHWHTNFLAGQAGATELRYVMTSEEGQLNATSSARFAAEACVPPVVVPGAGDRDVPQSGSLASLEPQGAGLLTFKPAEDGRGLIARIQNLRHELTEYALRPTSFDVGETWLTSPLEDDVSKLAFQPGGTIVIEVPGRSVRSVRIIPSASNGVIGNVEAI